MNNLDPFFECPAVVKRASSGDVECGSFIDHCPLCSGFCEIDTRKSRPPSMIVPMAIPSVAIWATVTATATNSRVGFSQVLEEHTQDKFGTPKRDITIFAKCP